MELRGNWNYPTTVRFGAGRVSELGEAVKAAKIANPLFVTDLGLAKLPVVQARLGHTQSKTTDRYTHVRDDADRDAVERLAARRRAARPE